MLHKVYVALPNHLHVEWSVRAIEVGKLVRAPEFGRLRAIHGFFSYSFTDPKNIRNVLEYGGGGLRDVGGYPIHTARFVTGREPTRVVATMEPDPMAVVEAVFRSAATRSWVTVRSVADEPE